MKTDTQQILEEKPVADPLVTLYRTALDLYSDLSQEGVLERMIEAAKQLAEARYAGVRLPGEDGREEEYICPGMPSSVQKTIQAAFRKEAWVDEMIQSDQSTRLSELSSGLDNALFPHGGKKRRALLSVPIHAQDRTLGHMILIEKIGEKVFSAADQSHVEVLASSAGAALENARLYQRVIESEREITQRNLELEVINSLATMVGSAADLENMSRAMLTRIQNLYGATVGEVFRSVGAEGEYRLVVRTGVDVERFWEVDRFRLRRGFLGETVQRGEIRVMSDLVSQEEVELQELGKQGFTKLVSLPLKAPGKIAGLLNFAVRTEAPRLEDQSMLKALSAGMGIAIENSRLYQQARRIAVLEERERIGMDLHDGVIQSIYAVGLMLDYTKLLIEKDPENATLRLQESIDALNSTIRDIRSYILDLQPIRIPSSDLLPALERLVREFKANTLIETAMDIQASAFQHLKPSVVNNFFLIAQEALANVAKHAHATRVTLAIRELDGEIEMCVEDNGRGFEISSETGVLGHGLSNMLSRAQSAGGELVVNSNRSKGTTVTARFPLT